MSPVKPSKSSTPSSTGKLKKAVLRSKTLTKSDISFEPELSGHYIWLVYGDAGTKKTSFGFLNCPSPVMTFNLDGRDGPAHQRAVKMGKEIARVRIKLPAGLDKLPVKDSSGKPLRLPKGQEIASKLMDKFWRAYDAGIELSKEGNLNTFLIDTAYELTAVMSASLCGRTVSPKTDYGRTKGLINQMWRDIIDKARNEGEANLVILDRASEIWKDNRPTGYFTYRSPSVIFDGVDIAANIRLRKKATGGLTDQSELMIAKAGGDLRDIGELFREKDWGKEGPFNYVNRLQMGKRDDDDEEEEEEELEDDDDDDEEEEE
jgi:hypothetical protein